MDGSWLFPFFFFFFVIRYDTMQVDCRPNDWNKLIDRIEK